MASISPPSGQVGAAVTITGTAFTGAIGVRFNGTPAAYTVDSYSQITATVPVGAMTGPIRVQTPDGWATSSTSFIVTTPTVSPTPTTGPPGTKITVSGSWFGASEGVDIYFDTTDLALAVTSATGSFSGFVIKAPTTALPSG